MKTSSFVLLIALLFFWSRHANAQYSDSTSVPLIYVDELPIFPGGEAALEEFIKDRMYYPEDARNDGMWGRVFVRFAVSPDGDVRDISISKSLYPSLDSVAIGILEAMPKWKRMKDVRDDVYITLPLFFTPPEPNVLKDRIIYRAPDERAQFVGGESEMYNFIVQNLKYPIRSCHECKPRGKVFVQFVITKEGSVTNPIIIKSLNESCDKETIRVVNAMPDWMPAKVNGELVDSYFLLPLTFQMRY